jgi:hypothetical protein
MKNWLDVSAIVYLVLVFRDSRDYLTTFSELSPPEQAFMLAAAVALVTRLIQFLDQFRKL